MTRASRPRNAISAAVLLIATADLALAAPAAASVCEKEMARAAKVHSVPLPVLYAVGLTESGRKGQLQPFAMNIEGAPVFARDLGDATARFRAAERQGRKLIDVGCMQINHHYHRRQFASLEQMFDPARNVDYAARFLAELRAREGSWSLAVARYHAGPANTPAQRRYICAVIRQLVASGVGAWTVSAKSLCLDSNR